MGELGAIMDDTLTWSKHITYIRKLLKSVLFKKFNRITSSMYKCT